jgi:hypothetical protein
VIPFSQRDPRRSFINGEARIGSETAEKIRKDAIFARATVFVMSARVADTPVIVPVATSVSRASACQH